MATTVGLMRAMAGRSVRLVPLSQAVISGEGRHNRHSEEPQWLQ